jgi:hypothetical protein
MAAARQGAASATLEGVWQASIDGAVKEASTHALDHRFGKPERWPGYYLVRQRALSSAIARSTAVNTQADHGSSHSIGPERRLQTRDGKLVGRPDSYNGRTITEYKSSLPDASWPNADQILDEYRRQIRLYAAIIADVDGKWPAAGKIVAASGHSLTMPIVREECALEAADALEANEKANASLGTVPVQALGTPSADACARCLFQSLCPAFWAWIREGGAGDLPTVAAQASATGLEVGLDGDVYSAKLSVTSASHDVGREQVIVLRRSIHGGPTIAGDNEWRVSGARLRPDGRLQADLCTIVMSANEVPRVIAHEQATRPN